MVERHGAASWGEPEWRSPPARRTPRSRRPTPRTWPAPDVQRGIYFAAGGQPGHRVAWLDEGVNAASSDFFRDTWMHWTVPILARGTWGTWRSRNAPVT
jgi:hypothetical protein